MKNKSDITNGKIFYLSLIFYIGGIFLGNFFQLNFYWLIILFSLSLAFLISNHKNKRNILIFFCVLGLISGFLRINKVLQFSYDKNNTNFNGEALIIEKPREKTDYIQLIACSLDEEYRKCKEKFIIYASVHSNYKFKDLIKLNCHLEKPRNDFAENNFNYQLFLANKNIHYICKNSEIEKINLPENFNTKNIFWKKIELQEKLYDLSDSLSQRIDRLFIQPEGGYLGGLLLGGEDRMPANIVENFRKTGTTHTVAVSGSNITIIAEFLILISISIGFWRKQAIWIAISGIILFVLMIGSPSSAVRAAIMGIILMVAHNIGRLNKAYYAVIFSATLMLTFYPLALIYDSGFQLSFLASLGIILIYSPLSKKIGIENDFLELKSILLVTITAQLGVLGIIIFNFEIFSLSSLIVNLIILPLIPIIMLLGFLTVIISYFSLFLAQIFSYPTWLLLHFEIEVVNFFSKFDFLSIQFSKVSPFWLLGYYTFFILLVIYLKRKIK